MKLKIKRVGPVAVPLPEYQTAGAVGMDLHAAIEAAVRLEEYANWSVEECFPSRAKIPTGICIAVPAGYEAQVRPRSSLSAQGIVVAVGTIDSDYRGEISVIVMNLSSNSFTIRPGDRIAQLVVAPVVRAYLEEVDDLDITERGANGFGSTGVGVTLGSNWIRGEE